MIKIFIISWVGQHNNAIFIAESLSGLGLDIVIVYSDPDPNINIAAPCNLVRRSNDLYWEDKFKACLDLVGDSPMLVIHADCTCKDWKSLIARCLIVSGNVKKLGVWAPRIIGTPYDVSVSGILKIDSKLVLSARTDGIVFYLSSEIIDRMKKVTYGGNKFGWGIESLFCATSHSNGKLVLIDLSVEVFHPQGKTGYDSNEAQLQKIKFLNQFTISERGLHELLEGNINFKRAKIQYQKFKSH